MQRNDKNDVRLSESAENVSSTAGWIIHFVSISPAPICRPIWFAPWRRAKDIDFDKRTSLSWLGKRQNS